MRSGRWENVFNSELQRVCDDYEARIESLRALLLEYETEEISQDVQVDYEEDVATTKISVHSFQQTEEDSARFQHFSQQTEVDLPSLEDSSQQTVENFQQLRLRWKQEFDQERKLSLENPQQTLNDSSQQTELNFASSVDSFQQTEEDLANSQSLCEQELEQERKMGAEKSQQIAVEKCRLQAEVEKYQLDAQDYCEEIGKLRATIEGRDEKIQSQQDQIQFLNSQHEQDLCGAQSLTRRLDDEAINSSRPIQAMCEEPEFCGKILIDISQQTEEDSAQLPPYWEHEFDCERRIHAERLQQAVDEKCGAQDDLANVLIELGGLREKVYSSELELELQMRKNEEEVRKIHANYDPQRRQDEERKHARVKEERERIERRRKELHDNAWSIWVDSSTDKRSREEFERDYSLQMERHHFNQQFPEGAELSGVMLEGETTEQGTETDVEQIGLLDECTPDIETREQGTETDAEQMEPRSSCVSPAVSSLMSLISSRRRLSESGSESSEESGSTHSDSEPGPPVLSSGSSVSSSQSTEERVIDPTRRTLFSKDASDELFRGVCSDTAMDEDIEGLQLYGGDAEPVKLLFRSLLQVDSSAGLLDEKVEIVPDGRSKGSNLVPSEGEMTASASSVEAMSSVMSTTFLRTLDQFAKMAEVTSDAVVQLKRRPAEPNQRVRSSANKRRRKAYQRSVSTQQQIRDLEITLRTTVESLTMTQKRLDEAESQLREGAAVLRELEENPQSGQQDRSSGECGYAGRRSPLPRRKIEEENPSCFASYPENVAGRVDIRAAASPTSARSTAGSLGNAGDGPHIAAIELRGGSATQQNRYPQHDVFPAIQGEADGMNTTNQQNRAYNPKLRRYSWTSKGTPVCWTCQTEGHMRKQCNISRQHFQESIAFQPEVAEEKSKSEALEVLQERRRQLEIATSRQLKIAEEKPKFVTTKPLQERSAVAQGPKRGLIVTEVEINGKVISSTVDTGSEATILHEEAAKVCLRRNAIKPSDLSFKDIAGKDMGVIGCADVVMKIGGQSFAERVYIVPGMKNDLLLGTNFLEDAEGRIKYPERELYLRGKKVPTKTITFKDGDVTLRTIDVQPNLEDCEEFHGHDGEIKDVGEKSQAEVEKFSHSCCGDNVDTVLTRPVTACGLRKKSILTKVEICETILRCNRYRY